MWCNNYTDRMIRRLLLSMLVVCLVVPLANVQARLGDTEKEIEARYGQSIGIADKGDAEMLAPTSPTKKYVKAGLVITVGYLEGISAMELFRREDGEKMQRADEDELLKANRGSSEWKESDEDAGKWTRKDERASATHDSEFFFVLDSRLIERRAKDRQKELSGF